MPKLIMILLILFSAAIFYSEDEEIVTHVDKVLILPIENQSDSSNYINTGVYQTIVFRSFYSFIGLIPVINVPEQNVLSSMKASDADVSKLADANDADYVIYGDYRFEGTNSDPTIQINLKAWSEKKSAIVFSKTYQTDTSGEIFNTIDNMMTDVLRDSLNIRFKSVALLSFKNFQIKNDTYTVMINDRMISVASNSSFALNLRILPNTDYRVKLVRNRDTNTVLQNSIRLKPNESYSIGYTAFGRLDIGPILYRDREYQYTLYLDDQIMLENRRYTNVTANNRHSFRTVQSLKGISNVMERIDFSFADGGTNYISPRGKAPVPVHFKIYSLDNSMIAGGLDIFFGRYLWLGGAIGFSTFTSDPKQTPEDSYVNPKGITFNIMSYTFEFGYFVLGDMMYDWRMGLGIDIRNGFVLPKEDYQKYFPNASYDHWNFGSFMDLEWKFLLFRPALYLYQYNNVWKTTYGLGVGFKL